MSEDQKRKLLELFDAVFLQGVRIEHTASTFSVKYQLEKEKRDNLRESFPDRVEEILLAEKRTEEAKIDIAKEKALEWAKLYMHTMKNYLHAESTIEGSLCQAYLAGFEFRRSQEQSQ